MQEFSRVIIILKWCENSQVGKREGKGGALNEGACCVKIKHHHHIKCPPPGTMPVMLDQEAHNGSLGRGSLAMRKGEEGGRGEALKPPHVVAVSRGSLPPKPPRPSLHII